MIISVGGMPAWPGGVTIPISTAVALELSWIIMASKFSPTANSQASLVCWVILRKLTISRLQILLDMAILRLHERMILIGDFPGNNWQIRDLDFGMMILPELKCHLISITFRRCVSSDMTSP